MEKTNKEIIKDLLVGLCIAFLTTVFGFWLDNQYSKPVIEIDNNGGLYSIINETPVGLIFIGNSGKETDKNISVKIDGEIDKEEVSTPGFMGDYSLKDTQDGTVITIEELRPSETVHVFFTPKDKTVKSFEILSKISDSNNIFDLYYLNWWDVSSGVKGLFLFCILLSSFLGWYLPKRIPYYIKTTR